MSETKNPKVEAALKLLHKKFGEDSALTFDTASVKKVDTVSTGSLNLDLALGVGGLPLGRICEIFGPESSGKSTICLHVCAAAQKLGYTCAYLDLEHAFDARYAEKLGINLKELIFCQPNSGEEAFQIMEELLKEKLVNVIIFDSIASARTRAEIEGEVGDSFIGRQAKLMSDGLKKVTPLAFDANCLCLFTNQLRMKIGVMFGNPETTSGGEAMKYYSSVRMRISRTTAPITDSKKEAVGNDTKVKVIKNKVAPPFREACFQIIYGKGINSTQEVVNLAVKFDYIQKKGGWYYYGEEKMQGEASVLNWLSENPDVKKELEDKVKEKVFSLNEDEQEQITSAEGPNIELDEEGNAYNATTGEVIEE